LAEQAKINNDRWLATQKPFDNVQWDELITFEHSRLKPLSIAVMTCVGTRCIIGFGVAQIPAAGTIAKVAREKYGHRRDQSAGMRKSVLKQLSVLVAPNATITTDEHARYSSEIAAIFPTANHIQHPSVRGSLTGQGELKRTGFDPLWNVNHNLAMLRDGLKRLARRTWCTTKTMKGLEDELAIYIRMHNAELIPQPTKRPTEEC